MPITGYQVMVVQGQGRHGRQDRSTVAAGKTSYSAKLKAGKYKFAVVALNAVGAGPQSALSKTVTAR